MPFRLSPVCLTILLVLASLSTAQQPPAQQPAAKPARARAVNEALLPIEDDPKLPRVLLIGDSISIGYTLPVRKLLAGRANVHRIAANGADTRTGVAKIDSWLGEGKWDVIHFNWGLHDIKRSEEGNQVPLGQYRQNLEQLVERLERTGARLLWTSTTPVPNANLKPERRNADVLAYNNAAKKIMEAHHIAIDDLYIFAEPQLAGIQIPANVHFTPHGSQELAERVAASIAAALTLGPPSKAATTSAK